MKQITKETTLEKILEQPKTKKILVKYNLPCLSCPFAQIEMHNLKIGDICKMYNLDTNNLIKDLNKVCK